MLTPPACRTLVTFQVSFVPFAILHVVVEGLAEWKGKGVAGGWCECKAR